MRPYVAAIVLASTLTLLPACAATRDVPALEPAASSVALSEFRCIWVAGFVTEAHNEVDVSGHSGANGPGCIRFRNDEVGEARDHGELRGCEEDGLGGELCRGRGGMVVLSVQLIGGEGEGAGGRNRADDLEGFAAFVFHSSFFRSCSPM